jgi:hypothetical protein
MSIEAMKQALDALETHAAIGVRADKAIAALQQAIAEAEKQEREWVGLTDENVRELWSWSASAEAERTANTQQHAFARAIEAKLREKNEC